MSDRVGGESSALSDRVGAAASGPERSGGKTSPSSAARGSEASTLGGNTVRLSLFGCGTVGSEVVRLLHEQSGDLTARIGARLELVGVPVRRPRRQRGNLPI